MCDLCEWQLMVDRLDDLIVHDDDDTTRQLKVNLRLSILTDQHCFDHQRKAIEDMTRPDTPERTRDEIDRRQAATAGGRSAARSEGSNEREGQRPTED